MTGDEFASLIVSCLPYAPNEQQALVIDALARFCAAPYSPDDRAFILNGYAGTGKTSLCAALVKALGAVKVPTILLAPTGRAAKVFANHSGHAAYTIHRRIYRHVQAVAGVTGSSMPAENRSTGAIFIVDEASMIPGGDAGGPDLLADLIQYVYSGHHCRMILVGDTAQLPPVGTSFSPAMNADTLRTFGLRVASATLTRIARQGAHSGILYNATLLRRAVRLDLLPEPNPKLDFPDARSLEPDEAVEEIYNAYSRDGAAETIVVTRSNQRATAFNREIRASVLYRESELEKGEMMIVGKNSYFWTRGRKDIDFIANGDAFTVTAILSTEHKYGLRFADVEIAIAETDVTLQAKLMLDVIASDFATATREQMMALYKGIINDPDLFSPMTPMPDREKALADNPYWNAIQAKYGYCVTCHKAQGGQWKNVFVDMAYIPPEAMGLDFYRWLYTAVTRAREHLYILE